MRGPHRINGLPFLIAASVLIVACHNSRTARMGGATLDNEAFGQTKEGTPVQMFTLTNANGLVARIMTYGATLVQMHVPDRDGRLADVVLGFDSVQDYESDKNQFFGCTTGRVANRIAGGTFTLDGLTYRLATNNGPNHLHGGDHRNLSMVVWHGEAHDTDDGASVTFNYLSPDGEEGYPGNLSLRVTYTLTNRDELRIDYHAETDAPTPVNLTNHSYWNLAGEGSALGHLLHLKAGRYTLADETLIPTGEILPVAGTPLDFSEPTAVGARIESLAAPPAYGYDHNYVLDHGGGKLGFAGRLHDPTSGRTLEVLTTEPGVQLYSGNHLNGQIGKGGQSYERHAAVCLETQHFPDSVNQPGFPTVILRPGDVFTSSTVHRFYAR